MARLRLIGVQAHALEREPARRQPDVPSLVVSSPLSQRTFSHFSATKRPSSALRMPMRRPAKDEAKVGVTAIPPTTGTRTVFMLSVAPQVRKRAIGISGAALRGDGEQQEAQDEGGFHGCG
jgi:hypothetical protein